MLSAAVVIGALRVNMGQLLFYNTEIQLIMTRDKADFLTWLGIIFF